MRTGERQRKGNDKLEDKENGGTGEANVIAKKHRIHNHQTNRNVTAGAVYKKEQDKQRQREDANYRGDKRELTLPHFYT